MFKKSGPKHSARHELGGVHQDSVALQAVTALAKAPSQCIECGVDPRNVQNYVRPHTKLHEIECNDVKIAFVIACRKTPGYDGPVPDPRASPRLMRLAAPGVAVEQLRFENCDSRRYWDRVRDPRSVDGTGWLPIRPDRFMILKIDGKVEPFFIEVDRGTESLTRIREKIRAYKSYYFTGRYAQRYRDESGRPLPSYRVLWVAPSDKRRDNLCRQALLENSPRMHWIARREQAMGDPLGSVWGRGLDLRFHTCAASQLLPQERFEKG